MKNEAFVSKNDKAHSIFNWWNDTYSPSYHKYKSAVKHSDVLDYKKTKELADNNNLSFENILAVI